MAQEVLVTVSVVLDVEHFPVPETEYKHVLAEVIGALAALISDDLPEVAIDRIKLCDSHSPLPEQLLRATARDTWPPKRRVH